MFLVVLATVGVTVALAVRLQNLLLGLPKGSPRLKMRFGIFFCLQSQIAVWALKRLRAFLLSLRMRMIREYAQAHMVKKMVDLYQKSSLKGITNTMISSPLKPHTNAHTVCGRPTLHVFERFMKGSLRGLYERSVYERTFPSEPFKNLKNNAISNELSNVNHVKKHERYRVFTILDVIVGQCKTQTTDRA